MSNANNQYRSSIISMLVGKLSSSISSAILDDEQKQIFLHRLSVVDSDPHFMALIDSVSSLISSTDLKYILCFYIQMPSCDIATVFNVDVHSIYTARYRIRKKLHDVNGTELFL